MFFSDSYGQNDIKTLFNQGKQNNKPLENHYSNYSNSEKKYKKLSYTPINANNNNLVRKKRSTKRVKFNNKVDIVLIESYKEYNKMDDGDFNYMDYFNNVNTYAKAQQMNNINKKQGDGCTCYIS